VTVSRSPCGQSVVPTPDAVKGIYVWRLRREQLTASFSRCDLTGVDHAAQGLDHAGLGHEPVAESIHPGSQRLARREPLQQLAGSLGKPLHLVLIDGVDKRLPRREVPVESGDAEPMPSLLAAMRGGPLGPAATLPDLDLSPVAVIARLSRLRRLRRIIDAELAATFAEHGLDGPDFSALVTLRRLDQPAGVTQRQLMRELNLSSGTVSVRVERLSDRGLVSRATDPADRHNSLISLTEAGRAMFDAVTPAHIATENRLLSALSEQQRGELACLLRTLLVSFEGSAGEGPFPLLGLTLAPAHHTLDARRAVGLPGLTGLLVRDALPGSRAEHAGIRPGDVLVRAGGSELRAITTLYAVINDAIGAGTLTVEIVRGEKTSLELAIDLHPQPGDDLPPGNTAPPAATAAHTL